MLRAPPERQKNSQSCSQGLSSDTPPCEHVFVIELLMEMRDRLAESAEGLDVDAVAASDAARLWVALASVERLVSGLRLVLTPRAADAALWKAEGFRSFESWAAAQAGTSRSDAARDAKVADQLDFLPDVGDALRRGEISPRQAEQVTEAAAADPGAHGDLLREALQGRPVEDLRKDVMRRKAQASSREEEHQRMRRWREARDVRFWVAPDGLAHLDAMGPLAELAPVKAAMEQRADKLFDACRRGAASHGGDSDTASHGGEGGAASERPAPRHLRFDALVELVTEPRPTEGCATQAPHWTITVLADAGALRRGYVGPGEGCEIPGVGPVPVESAQAVLGDAFLDLVLKDGVDVRGVVSAGRSIPKSLKVAVFARDRGCVVCGSQFNLEYDHWRRRYADGGLTCLSNLAVICRRHHRMRHHDGWILDGGPGHWTWSPPGSGGAEAAEAPLLPHGLFNSG